MNIKLNFEYDFSDDKHYVRAGLFEKDTQIKKTFRKVELPISYTKMIVPIDLGYLDMVKMIMQAAEAAVNRCLEDINN